VEEYKGLLKLFSEHLEKHIAGQNLKQPRELYEPEQYILSLGGKRIRPLLALIACDLFEKDPKRALQSALAVELFHNFSLIHDDILDAAPLRRNQPTVHKKWGTNTAILSGDVMLVKSIQELEQYSTEEYKQLANLFTKTAIEVCEGQQMDMNFESMETVTVKDYLHMITFKTAVLLGCSLKMGAINAGASEADQQHIYDFGKNLGIAFQLMDDCLDVFAEDQSKFGKQTGGDIISNKKTFLLLKAMETANETQLKEVRHLLNLPNAELKVQGMTSLYKDLNIQRLCLEEADELTKQAIDCLEKTRASKEKKETLKKFAFELLNRQA
jgi:geranylgeranyl diphosphate synthase, type II